MNKMIVPVNEPLLDGNEESYLVECIRTGWISSEGPFIKRFEENMARVCSMLRTLDSIKNRKSIKTKAQLRKEFSDAKKFANRRPSNV